jgi:hypothetical protein
MAEGIWALEWLNENSQRSYPLAEHVSSQDTTGDFTIPDDFMVGLYLPVHAGLAVDPGRFHVHLISVFAAGYSITIGYTPVSGVTVDVASAIVAKHSHTENATYALAGLNDFEDTVGQLVIGNTDSIDQQPAGQYEFTLAGAALDTDTVRPIIRGVSSIRVLNGTETSRRVTGDIELQAGRNISLQLIELGDNDPIIRIDAVDGVGLNDECACDDGDTEAPAIRTINGIPPDSSGDFTVLGDDCLRINPISNGVQLADECSAPCCGCEELEAITRDLEQFGDNAHTLQLFVNRLGTEVTQMNMVVLGSRLNDNGCLSQ